MEAPLQQAVLVMAIGMATVFLVLFMVTVTGKVLIWAVNTFATEEKGPRMMSRITRPRRKKTGEPAKLAAIIAAVDAATGGQGKIERIERIS